MSQCYFGERLGERDGGGQATPWAFSELEALSSGELSKPLSPYKLIYHTNCSS